MYGVKVIVLSQPHILYVCISQNEVGVQRGGNIGPSYSSSLYIHYTGWDVWSAKVILFSHPHLLSAAAAGWPGVVGALSGQWKSVWWPGRSLCRGGETRREGERQGGGGGGGGVKAAIPQRTVSRMLEVDHTNTTCNQSHCDVMV